MVEHTVKAFDDEIGRLRGLIAEMGGLAEAAIANAIAALIEHDEEKGQAVVAADAKLDALEAEVDRLAVRIIALRAPMADDLRDVIAALKISGVIERIGDYAKNIAKRVGQVEGRAKIEPHWFLPWLKSHNPWCAMCSMPMRRGIRSLPLKLLFAMKS
jgi:phosphate transport system protein